MLTNQYNELGKKEGLWESFWDSGGVYNRGYYIDGKREGIWNMYFQNGQLSYAENYHNSLLEGYSISYYQDGEFHYKRCFRKGERCGFRKENFLVDANYGKYHISFYVN